MHGRGAQERLADFKLHNVAVTPLWLIISSRSPQPQSLLSLRSSDRSCISTKTGGWVALRDETTRLMEVRHLDWLGKMEGSGGGCSGEIHGRQCVVVYLNSLGQRRGVPAVTLP